MSRDPKSNYYDVGGIEVMDIIKAKLTPEQFEGYLLGNIIKYSCRCNFKGQFNRDLEKISIYQREIKNLKVKETEPKPKKVKPTRESAVIEDFLVKNKICWFSVHPKVNDSGPTPNCVICGKPSIKVLTCEDADAANYKWNYPICEECAKLVAYWE